MGNLRNENLSLLEQLNLMGGKSKRSIYIDDSLLKGGFRVVNTIEERDAIDCCHRKWGMEVTVVGPDLDFIRYTLRSRKCSDNVWIVSNAGLVSVNEAQVDLIEDYSELEENLANQRDLNLALKRAILQLQQEVIDIPTNTSELVNDGEDGINPFITLQDIPVVTVPTKTSDLINDGEGIDPFITLAEVPAQTPQVKSDWNAVSGPEEILNKPTIPVIVPQEQSDWNAVSGVSFIKNKPTIPAPVDISNKLDKPTTDGVWVVTRTAGVSGYADASTLGKNIANTNLTWTVDRIQDLGTKKLSFTNGRFSVPTLELEVTSANSVPNKISNSGIRPIYTGNDGVNKDVAFVSDINSSTDLLQRYVHSSNIVLIPTSVNYSEGTVTVPAHGLSIGVVQIAGAVPNSYALGGLISSDWESIPIEWSGGFVRLKAIDANTIEIRNTSVVIVANETSASNIGRLNFTKWHIEIKSEFNISSFPIGIKSVQLKMSALMSNISTDNHIHIALHNNSGVFINAPSNTDQNLGNGRNIRFYMPVIGLIKLDIAVEFSVYKGLNQLSISGVQISRTGTSSYGTGVLGLTTAPWATKFLNIQENLGIAGISTMTTGLGMLFNGSVIEIYKK